MNYKCVVSYIGNHYEGWQSQTRGTSIQEKIEDALYHITQQKINIIASGRTDAGVNARGQVFMFSCNKAIPARKYIAAINAYLPDDIRILDVQEKGPLFHARYNVRYKTYAYRIHQRFYDVFSKDYACQITYPLDFDKMQECIKIFQGTHDFTSFNASSLQEYPIQVRSIYNVSCIKEEDMITLTFTGKGFLRYQVRMMAAAIIDVGRGRLTIEDVQTMLQEKSRKVKRHNANANGLTLEYVDYFEMIALDEKIQIREFLRNDVLCDSQWTIEDLEQRIQNHVYPCAYAICTRNNQEMKGCFVIDQNKEACIYLYDIDDEKYIEEIDTQILTKLKSMNIDSYTTKPYDFQKNYLK